MIREIAAKLGVQVDAKDLDKFMSRLDQVSDGLTKLGQLFVGGAIAHFVGSQIEAADALGDTADRLGLSTDELQEFQYALKLTGAESEGAEKALTLLNKGIGEAAAGGAGAAAFSELGVSIKDANGNVKSALEVLPDVADAVAKAGSQGERTAIAMKFFGKSGTQLLPLLKRGREGVQELSAEFKDLGGGISKEVIESAGKVGDGLDRLKFSTKALTTNALALLLPIIETVTKYLLKGSAHISHLVRNTNVLKVAMVALSIAGASKLLPMLLTTIRTFTALRTAAFGVAIPFWAVVAVVGALFLIFEDLWTLMSGGDSLIGRILDKFGGVGAKAKLVDTLRQAWETIKKTWEDLKPVIEDLWKRIGAGATGAIPALANAFAAVVKGIAAGITAFSTLIAAAEKASKGDWTGAGSEITKGSDAIFGKRRNIKEIDAQGNVSEMEMNVGGLFGKTEADWQKATSHGGMIPPPNVTAQTQVTINATGLPNDQAVKAVTDGVAKGVGGATADAHAALKTHGGS